MDCLRNRGRGRANLRIYPAFLYIFIRVDAQVLKRHISSQQRVVASCPMITLSIGYDELEELKLRKGLEKIGRQKQDKSKILGRVLPVIRPF